MKLECTIKRSGGTDVELPPFGAENTVQFRPLDHTRAESPHVAIVSTEQANKLMSLDPKTYRIYDAQTPKVELLPPSPRAPIVEKPGPLQGSRSFPLVVDFGGGRTVQLQNIIAEAHKASDLTIDEWNALSEQEVDVKLQALIDSTQKALDDEKDDEKGDDALSVRELKKAIAEGTLTHEELRELMEKEQAQAEPRQSFIDVILKALK